jgi:hypothetical protein
VFRPRRGRDRSLQRQRNGQAGLGGLRQMADGSDGDGRRQAHRTLDEGSRTGRARERGVGWIEQSINRRPR